jgi:hypothetical protein
VRSLDQTSQRRPRRRGRKRRWQRCSQVPRSRRTAERGRRRAAGARLTTKRSCRLLAAPRHGAIYQSHQRHALSLTGGRLLRLPGGAAVSNPSGPPSADAERSRWVAHSPENAHPKEVGIFDGHGLL